MNQLFEVEKNDYSIKNYCLQQYLLSELIFAILKYLL